jgi:hypothetical protein
MFERREGADARAHVGGGRCEGHQLVRRQADAGAVEHVGVKIGQAGANEIAVGLERLLGHRGRDFRLDCGDQRVADADVAGRAQVLARVEHVAAADDEVLGIAGSERRSGRKRAPTDAERDRRRAGA